MLKWLNNCIFKNLLHLLTLIMDNFIWFLFNKLTSIGISCFDWFFSFLWWYRRIWNFRLECKPIDLFLAQLLSFFCNFLVYIPFPVLLSLEKCLISSIKSRVIVYFWLECTAHNLHLLFNLDTLLHFFFTFLPQFLILNKMIKTSE